MKNILHLLPALVLAAGCSDAVPPRQADPKPNPTLTRVRDCEGPAQPLAPTLLATLPPRDGRMQPDDQWADLAKKVPGGFAGVLYANGTPVLLLTDPSKAVAAKQALASALAPFDVSGAVVQQARWDFGQLVDWFNYLLSRTSVAQNDALISADKDESINRIRLGVENEAARARLVQTLANVPVPCDLVVVEITSRPVALDQSPAHSVR